jgi:hypothetical protein
LEPERPRPLASSRRAVLELLLIVGSILIAFGIDAWWAERGEEDLRRQHIAALIAEFAQTRSDIELAITGTESALRGTRDILSAMRREVHGEGPAPADPAALFSRSTNVGAFVAQDAVLTRMGESGELMTLRNDSILPLLGDWMNRVEQLEMDSGHLERNREETILNRMIAADIRLLGFYTWSTTELAVPVGEPQAEWRRLLSDPGLETAFAMRADRARRLLNDYRLALSRLETIDRLLRSELTPNPRVTGDP